MWIAYDEKQEVCAWAALSEWNETSVYVHRSCRNRGLGSQLAQILADFGKDEGLTLKVQPWNVAGERIYEKAGIYFP